MRSRPWALLGNSLPRSFTNKLVSTGRAPKQSVFCSKKTNIASYNEGYINGHKDGSNGAIRAMMFGGCLGITLEYYGPQLFSFFKKQCSMDKPDNQLSNDAQPSNKP